MIIDDALTDALRQAYVTPEGETINLAVDTANFFLGMFYAWDQVTEKLEPKLKYWVNYIVIGALTGDAITEKNFPQYRKESNKLLKEEVDEETFDQYDNMIDSIIYGRLRQENQFYADNEVLILNTVVDDAFNNYSKHIYESNPEVVRACEICQYKFLYKIGLVCSGLTKALELNTKLLGIR